MGARGPAGKPKALKELQGNPGKRPLNQHEPIFPKYDELPKPPAHLTTLAKKEFSRVVPLLHQAGILTQVDINVVAAYSQAFGRWVDAEKAIKIHGMTYESDKGNIIQRPEVGIASTAMKEMVSFAAEFGMTPSSRSRIKVEQLEDKVNPFAVFIGGAKKSG
ncbi:MAG: phage terminase small subunit P27 family [Syntrophomonadaceae bacterium]|nr:phage terminase small subunit P27 family [Syntrophomonadaceae bacterium]